MLPLLRRVLATIGVGGVATEGVSGKGSWSIGRDTDQSNYNLPTCHTMRLVLCQESAKQLPSYKAPPANSVSSLLFK